MKPALLTALCLTASHAHAGVKIVWESAMADAEPAQPHTVTLVVDGQKARIDAGDQAGRAFVWDAQAKAITVMQAQDKTYRRLTEADIKQMAEKFKQLQELMRQRTAGMPPEQRAQVEKAMRLTAPSADQKPTPWKFTATGKKQKVGSYDCELYDGVRGQTKQQACVVAWAKAPVKKDDLKALASLADTFRPLIEGPAGSTGVEQDLTSYPGFPVRAVSTLPDGEKRVTTLKSAERSAVDAAQFEVPEGYTEKTMPLGPPTARPGAHPEATP